MIDGLISLVGKWLEKQTRRQTDAWIIGWMARDREIRKDGDREMDGQTNRKKGTPDRHTGRQTDRQPDTQRDRQTDRQTDRQADGGLDGCKWMDGRTHGWMDG